MTIREQIEIINACCCRESELYGAWAKRHGMSYHTMMTLYALDREHAQTQKEIAEWWMIPKQTVHTVVKELEQKGYLAFEEGRKEKRIRFTPVGEAYVQTHLRGLYEAEERTMEALGPALCELLVQGCQAYTAMLEQEVARD